MLPLYAVVLPVIILFCGLCLDVGLLELKQLQMQAAADAAALAAELEAERGTGNWAAQGQADAGLNGFTNGVKNVTVTINQLATYGSYSGRYDSLQATISQTISTVFMGNTTLTANAVALLTPCLYFTGTGSLQYYTLDAASGSLLGTTCPVYVNTRLRVQGSGNIAVESNLLTGAASSSTVAGYLFPTPAYGVPVLTDPLASITSPSFSGTCNHTSYSLTSGIATLSPGTYCKGITLTNSTVTLSAGLYIITGGATWSNSTVSGSGVTLFFTQGGGGSFSKFTIQNYSNVSLSAPNDATSGGIPAILVFADRAWVPSNPQDFALQNSTIQGDGIWYLTGAGIYVSSCGTFTGSHYMGILADNTYFSGTYFEPLNNYSYVTTGNPFRVFGGLVQ